jgi:hypothetical protein
MSATKGICDAGPTATGDPGACTNRGIRITRVSCAIPQGVQIHIAVPTAPMK